MYWVLVLWLLLVPTVHAQLYQCTDTLGKTIYTDKPCAGEPRPPSTPSSKATPPLQKATPTIPSNSPYHEKLVTLPESEQMAIFEAIGPLQRRGCKVNRTFVQGTDSGGNAYWNVGCRNKESYVVQFRSDGTTSTMACSTLVSIGATPCFEKFKKP